MAYADSIHSEQIDVQRFTANLSCLQSVIPSNVPRNDISLENIMPDAKIQSLNASSLIKTNDSAMHDVILDDIGTVSRDEMSESIRTNLLQNHFVPDKSYCFPARPDKKGKNLCFSLSWLDNFPWLVYSKSQNAGYCLPCVLFATRTSNKGCQFGTLVTIPFTKFAKALGKDGVLSNHSTLSYHQHAVAAQEEFKRRHKTPMSRIDCQLLQQCQAEFEQNKSALKSIIECIIYCGKQSIPLRGHRDDSTAGKYTNKGNLKALIEFRAETDATLRQFLKSCARNAQYTSKTIQNDIIDIIGEMIRQEITKHINKNSPFFSVICDEVTDDIANRQIFSLCIRYLQYSNMDCLPEIHEDYIDFAFVERATADHLLAVLKQCLERCGLDLNQVRGQAYDTTSSMSSDANGLQAKFRNLVPSAVYCPCNSHKLNLVIASASKLQQIGNCIAAVNEAFLFFDVSPKRQRFLEKVIGVVTAGHSNKVQKLIGLCKTRWVERFEAFDNFVELSTSVLAACEIIQYPHLYTDQEQFANIMSENWNWDNDTRTRAQGILASLQKFETAVSLVVLKNVLQPLRGITTKLQKRDIEICSAYADIDQTMQDLKSFRANIDKLYSTDWYQETKSLAQSWGAEEKRPRMAGRQMHRHNPPSESTETFYRRSVVIPFIDEVLEQLHTRFSPESRGSVTALLNLVPARILKVEQSTTEMVEPFKIYEGDLPRLSSLAGELEIWRNRYDCDKWHCALPANFLQHSISGLKTFR
jgi:hypothetical protein